MSESNNLGRRDLLRRALVVLAAAPVLGPALASCGSGELTCSTGGLTAAQLVVRSSLHYTDRGADPSRHCSGCQLYTGGADACGTCASIPGSIHPRGTCDAFAVRA